MKVRKLSNVSNITAFGVEWTEESGTTFQLVNIRGTQSLMMGVRPVGTGRWTTVPVSAPERFVSGPIRTQAHFNGVVEKWFAAAEVMS